MRYRAPLHYGTPTAVAFLAAILVLALLAPQATHAAGTTERVSVDSDEVQATGRSLYPEISDDGRYVVFASDASNLVRRDRNSVWDVFLRDRQLGTTERISVSSSGAEANGDSAGSPAISADGRFVVFASVATNLANDSTPFAQDIFVRDRSAGTTELVSLNSAGVQANNSSSLPQISDDGRYVVFVTSATNMVASDTNFNRDVYLRDRVAGTTELISRNAAGTPGTHESLAPAMSSDGRFVAFESYSTNLVPGDWNGIGDVFVRDRQMDTIEIASRDNA